MFLIDSLEIGGAERVLIDVCEKINYNKFDVTVKTIFNAGEYKNDLNKNVKYITIFKKPNKWVRRIFVRIEKIISPKILYYFFMQDIYDVEVAFLENMSTRILSGSISNAKKIAWIHTDFSTNRNSRSLYANNNKFIKAYDSFDKIICVSDSVKSSFEKVTGIKGKTQRIYNPIDAKKIIELSDEKTSIILNKNTFNIVLLGRLAEEKGYLRLLKIIDKLRENVVNFKVYIIGDGLKRKELEEYIISNKLEKYVSMLGFLKNPYPVMRQADLFLSASKVEGFSLALAEAMILNLPVICTNTSGPNEIIGENSEYGMLIENNSDEIYNALVVLIHNDRLLDEIKKKVENRINFFNIDEITKQIEKVLEK